jgi:hypothetical protein
VTTINTNANNNLELLYNGDRLGDLMELLDDLHTAASENTLSRFTTLGEQDVLGLLKELVYTAQETINEIEANRHQRESRNQRGQEKRQYGNSAHGRATQPMPANVIQFSEHFGQHIVQEETQPLTETQQIVSGTRHA